MRLKKERYYPFRLLDGRIAEGRRILHESDDCTVAALSVVTDTPYNVSHEVLQKAGRKPRRGFRMFNLLGEGRILLQHQFRRLDIPRMRLQRFMATYTEGTFLARKSGHVFSVKNGCLIDNYRVRPGSIITDVWQVTPRSPNFVFDKSK